MTDATVNIAVHGSLTGDGWVRGEAELQFPAQQKTCGLELLGRDLDGENGEFALQLKLLPQREMLVDVDGVFTPERWEKEVGPKASFLVALLSDPLLALEQGLHMPTQPYDLRIVQNLLYASSPDAGLVRLTKRAECHVDTEVMLPALLDVLKLSS